MSESIRPALRRWSGALIATTTLLASFGFAGAATPAFAASGIGGKITRSELIARADDWMRRAPAYDPNGSVFDAGQTRKYRTDCSGFVDMAWHLNSDDNTTDFAADPSRFVEVSGRGADKSGLRPGDLLNDTIDGHAFLFEAWESDHVHFSYFNFGGLDGSAPPEHHTHETFSQAKVGFEPTGNYVAYRYVNVVDDPGVSAVYDAAGAYHVFSINKDGTLYQRIHTADGWGAFQNLGGTVHGTPGVTYHDGRYDVFAIGGGGALYQQIYDGTWHGWTKIGGSNLVGGVQALYVNGVYHIFAINNDGTLYQLIHNADGWGDWQNLGSGVSGVPGVTYHDGRYDVFAAGGEGVLYQKTYDGTWHDWNRIGGSNLTNVEALYVDGAYHVFAINNDGTLYQIIHNSDGWGSWQNLDGTVHGTPGITYHGGRYDVFAVGGTGAIYQQTYDGTWHGWGATVGGSDFY
ncbi:hypothetical protein GCM10009765_36990 [Fodinicola feengrottensis]|uniref:PLL-like beta propeller domain-containing protein n=1 Tax=Fodinicola feengrottensis TaxID=435914 RepID=A0ABP4T8T3_9ACTN